MSKLRMPKFLNVLVVDDSPTARELLGQIVNSAPDMRAVGPAKDGLEAVKMTHDLHPDIILMDVIMPRMNGLEATREIMHAVPTPIVLVSASLETHETGIAFRAMSLGALAVHRKPNGPMHADHILETTLLLNKLRLMAEVQVIRHRKNDISVEPVPSPPSEPPSEDWPGLAASPEIIAIVASTGGPGALVTIIEQLPPDFAIPIVIVQHISADFVDSLRNWLARMSPLPVALAQHDARPLPGSIFLAPGGRHLRLTRSHRFELDETPSTAYHIPSGDILLESVGLSYGERATGIVLTGIGDDGARGLRTMYDRGAFTIAQDEATSAVYGMPSTAYALGAVRQVLPLPEIAPTLIRLSGIQEVNPRT
jgi:two-component system chemotaxis response regulator CheB